MRCFEDMAIGLQKGRELLHVYNLFLLPGHSATLLKMSGLYDNVPVV